MAWDGIIFLAFVALCLAGWNVGGINSWRGPLACLVATLATQQFYIDFATWIVQQLFVKPDWATFMAYLMMWVAIEITTEVIMNLTLPWNRKERPMVYDRIGGVALAIFRWVLIVTLPLMAMHTPNKVPTAPEKEAAMINLIDMGFQDSHLVSAFTGFAKNLQPAIGGIVTSDKEPSFKANFKREKVIID